MRTVNLLVLLVVLALVGLALTFVPSCIAPWVETPADWKARREEMRKSARESVERLEKQYGDTPIEEWDERHRLIYRNARRILGDLGGNP